MRYPILTIVVVLVAASGVVLGRPVAPEAGARAGAPAGTRAGAPVGAVAGESSEPAAKELIIDGSVVHDVGRLHLNVTNWGLIGSHYSMETPYADAPSARWPGADGIDHLWGAGLWVGGIQAGERKVSTGQYETELRATRDPLDVIYETAWDAPAAARYPFDHPDDDGDGLEDEDPPNGRDDDGDGLVDEDMAGISDQLLRSVMNDTLSTDLFPDHEPLRIEVVQQSYQWAADEAADFVGFDFTITNRGATPITELYAAIFSDFDIDDPGGPADAADDLCGFFAGTVEAYPGQPVDVAVAYMFEGDGATTSGYIGWLPVGHPTDPDGVAAPAVVGVRSFQRFSGQAPFDQGGDPTNDSERYEAMSWDQQDSDSPGISDFRLLTSVGPFAALGAGESLTVSYVLVIGADLESMLRNAARARLVYEGLAFDRDGDPANGAEYVVRWLGPEEIAVPVADPPASGGGAGAGPDGADQLPAVRSASLRAAPNPFNPRVAITAELVHDGAVRVSVLDVRGREVRVLHDGAAAAGERRWIWDGRDQRGERLASGVYLVRLASGQRILQRAVTLVK